MERAKKDEGWCHQDPAQALWMDGGEETPTTSVCVWAAGISLSPHSLIACPALFLQAPPRRTQETLVLRSTSLDLVLGGGARQETGRRTAHGVLEQ